jgi:hypothetical protein
MTREKIRSASATATSLRIAVAVAVLSWLTHDVAGESAREASTDFNGGFEHVESGLPTDWLVYSPKTIPTGKYELSFDHADCKEGKQSLKFDVAECSSTGGWHSPGIAHEFPVQPGGAYRVSFWIKNDGCDYFVRAGGVSPKKGEYATVDTSNGKKAEWKRVQRELTVPKRFNKLRFELSIRSPGKLWIDDVRVEPIDDAAKRRAANASQ